MIKEVQLWRFYTKMVGFCLLIFSGCGNDPEDQAILTEVRISYSDTIVHKILDLQDRQETELLLPFLHHRDPSYRYLSALAFGSIRKNNFIDTLGSVLNDPHAQVKQAAAFALGQIGDSRAQSYLVGAFQNEDSLETNTLLNCTVLEAVGKCGDQDMLRLISNVTTYTPFDDLLLLGQTRAIYRFMQRGIIDSSGTEVMVSRLLHPDLPKKVKILAANYLARVETDLSSYSDTLVASYNQMVDPEIKMFLVIGLARTQTPQSLELLKTELRTEEDYRVRTNIIRALTRYNYPLVKRDIHRALYDKHIQVAKTAAESILNFGSARYWMEYMNLSLGSFPWQVKTILLHASNKFIPPGNAMFRNLNLDYLRQPIRNATNPYERASAVKALAANINQAKYIMNLFQSDEDLIMKTACLEGLASITKHRGFPRLNLQTRTDIFQTFASVMRSGDVGQICIAAEILGDANINATDYGVDPSTLLQEAQEVLTLPRDSEALQVISTSLSNLGIAPNALSKNVYTHPLEWEVIETLSDTTKAVIKTEKGDITIQFYSEAAPGTVANFIDLAQLNYYSGKYFHRVVPNFVIQGGCSRGDGYGSMDYNIRSELSQKYFDSEGLIGMASAGNHTESAQWFITHCPAPHLDGNFTLFGKVVTGMDVVHRIEVGDKIISVEII